MNLGEPESFIGEDKRGRFLYQDYDGEQLIIERLSTGALWIDKRGEGPVYVRPQDVAVIVAAMEGAKTPDPGLNLLAGHAEWCEKAHKPGDSPCSRRRT